MIIIGIDPGTARTGYGIIKKEGERLSFMASGCLKTSSKKKLPERLSQIFSELEEIIKRYKPNEAAIEEIFFAANTKTAIAVGHARGVLSLALEKSNIPIGEYTPLEIKQALVGYGRAEKSQVQIMVKNFLKLENIPKQDDAADALAVAICHAHSRKINNIL